MTLIINKMDKNSVSVNIPNKKISVCMACDFFFPSIGGVENHMYQLSVYLQRLGHKVIVITHCYKNRIGIRFMGNGIKVYYVPFKPLPINIIVPNLTFSTMKLLREILIKEKINLIHSHQATSILGNDVMHVGTLLKIPSVFTDHSLFGINDLAGVNISKVTKCAFVDIDQFISVSYVGRDNLFYRTITSSDKLNVIPNCIDFNNFRPQINVESKFSQNEIKNMLSNPFNPNKEPYDSLMVDLIPINHKKVTIVSISRQVYRKGTDLLVEVIPKLYKLFPNMTFIIGGDGPKKYLLDTMVETFIMHDRVKLMGAVPHSKVRETMLQGDIYLNVSLTETFCIAILEAASCGSFVISTNIGGVEEVLPEYMRILVESNCSDIINGVAKAVNNLEKIKEHALFYHQKLKNCYNWHKSVAKVEHIYIKAISTKKCLSSRISRIFSAGTFSALFYLCIILGQYFLFLLISLIQPSNKIKVSKDFDRQKYLNYLNSKIRK